MTKRTEVLQLAVLGLLQEAPMHGYELRKRLTPVLGIGRAFSYGTLYPCLRQLLEAGLIAEVASDGEPTSRRARIVYLVTDQGRDHFQSLLATPGPASWEDDQFGIRLAFFPQTEATVRLRILEGRRSRLLDQVDACRAALVKSRDRLDTYTLELQRLGLEAAERELSWLDTVITDERATPRGATPAPPGAPRPA